MDDRYEELLQEEFPFMMQSHDYKDTSVYRIYGCECSNGWYSIIRDCCRAIADEYNKAGIPVDFIPEQIKEKFGKLRFYYDFEDAPLAIHAFDCLGGDSLRFIPGSENDDDEKKAFRQRIAEIVHDAEVKSASVCEFCGREGRLRKDLRWVKTLCDEHYSKMEKKNAERGIE